MDCSVATVREFFRKGVAHAHEAHHALLKKYTGEYNEREWKQEDEQFDADKEKFGEEEAVYLRDKRHEQATLDHLAFPHPLWQQLSGLNPKDEKFMHPNERAGRIATLLRNVERMIRYELKQKAECGMQKADETEDGEQSTLIRPMLGWDPLRSVCFKLDISAAQLSRYMRETTGMSMRELVDCIRMESVRPRMKAWLREFVRVENLGKMGAARASDPSPQPPPARGGGAASGERLCDSVEARAEEIYAALKQSRRAPRWHRTSWAAEMGFSSYSKFFRACLLIYGMTPHELEMELIEEILEDGEVRGKRLDTPSGESAAVNSDLTKMPEGGEKEREAG